MSLRRALGGYRMNLGYEHLSYGITAFASSLSFWASLIHIGQICKNVTLSVSVTAKTLSKVTF